MDDQLINFDKSQSKPFFFGKENANIFGYYHAPQKQDVGKAILLCYPIGHEYFRFFRSFNLLANRLSTNGFHILRFDYYGTGDSNGESENCEICHWKENIRSAIEELKSLSGLSTISIIGLRFGASLAASVVNKNDDIEHFIGWDPVVNCERYIDGLKKTHSKMLKDSNRFPLSRSAEECNANEFLGFTFSDVLVNEIKKLSQSNLSNVECNQLTLLNTSYCDDTQQLASELLQQNPNAQYEEFETTLSWSKVKQIETSINIQEVLAYITKTLKK